MTPPRLNLIVDDADFLTETAPVVTRIFVLSATPGNAEMVARSLVHDDGVTAQFKQDSLSAFAADETLDLSEIDVLMFEIVQGDDAEVEAIRKLHTMSSGRVKFLGITSETLSLACAKQLMDAGVDEVMPLKIGRPKLNDTIAIAPEAEAAQVRRGGITCNGVIIAATQTRGGIGTTGFALNLAAMLTEKVRKSRSNPARVVVVDLDFQNGVLGACIDIQDNGSFIGFLKAQALADNELVAKAVQSYRDRFDVLSAPTEFAPLEALTPQMMASLLDELRLAYDYVILDLPRAIAHWLNPVLSRADQLFILTDLSVHSVRQARRLKDTFSDDHVSLPIEVVVSLQKRPFTQPEAAREAEKFFDQKLDHWIAPDERAAKKASDKGEPLALSHRKSPTVRSMTPLVAKLRKLAAIDTRRMA